MKHTLRSDLPASLVVFLVALPLSLGIALASGAPPESGLIAAVCGGIVVGLLGGAPLQVSGPAAGLTVLVYGFIQTFGLKTTAAITVAAGILQMAAGTLKLAELTLLIPPSVLQAMLAGIGFLISLGQIHVLLGSAPKGSAFSNLSGLSTTLQNVNPGAALAGGATFVTLLLWPRTLGRWFRSLPAPLGAVAIGTGVSLFHRKIWGAELPTIQFPDQLIHFAGWPDVGALLSPAVGVAAVSLMVVASAESLLCAVATDRLHSGPRADLDRELWAQGVGNAASGLLGGLPITGVIVRSSANIQAGAKGRYSAVFHGVWVLLCVLFCRPILEQVPLAVLAGLLIHVGVKLVKIEEIRRMQAYRESVVYVSTLVGVVFVGLLAGIGLGIAIAVCRHLYRYSRIELEVVPSNQANDTLEVTIHSPLSFLSVPALKRALADVPASKTIHLIFRTTSLDLSAIEAIRGWKAAYEATGGRVVKGSLDTLWKELQTVPRRARSNPNHSNAA